jgi:hypothetical protein
MKITALDSIISQVLIGRPPLLTCASQNHGDVLKQTRRSAGNTHQTGLSIILLTV